MFRMHPPPLKAPWRGRGGFGFNYFFYFYNSRNVYKIVSVLLSASVKRVGVSCTRDFVMEVWSLDRCATNVFLNSLQIFQMTEKFEKFHLDVALVSFLQLERHWQNGEAAELEISCEAGSLNIQSSQFCLSV